MNAAILEILTNENMRTTEAIENIMIQYAAAGIPWWSAN